MKPIAALIGLLYLVLLAFGWLLNITAGDEGIVNVTIADEGVLISELAAGSAATRAGLQVGDLVLAVNGVSATDGEGIHEIQHQRRTGDWMALRVQRQKPDGTGFYPAEDVVLTLQSQLSSPTILLRHLLASVVGLLIVGVALTVVINKPHDRAARLLLLFGECFAFIVAMDILHWGIPYEIATITDFASFFVMVIGCAALLHLFLAFPVRHPFLDRLERLGPQSMRAVGGGAPLLYLLPLAVPAAVASGITQNFMLLFLDFLVLLIAALFVLMLSYRQAPTPLVHAQLKWLTGGFLIFVAAFLLALILPAATGGRIQVLPQAAYLAALALFPASLGVAILRYRLWNIDVLIRRTLVYGTLTATLAAIYIGCVILLQGFFRTIAGQESELAIVVSTLAIATLFQPFRARLQRFIDRRFYRRQYDTARTLALFGTSIRDEVDLPTLTSDLVAVVEETLQPTHVSLWVRPPAR